MRAMQQSVQERAGPSHKASEIGPAPSQEKQIRATHVRWGARAGGIVLVVLALVFGAPFILSMESIGEFVAPVVSVRSATAGVIDSMNLRVGDTVVAGAFIAGLNDPRVDRGRLAALYSQRTAALARLEALRLDLANFRADSIQQHSQLEQQRGFESRVLATQVAEAEAQLASLAMALARLQTDSTVSAALYARSLTSLVDHQRVRIDATRAAAAVEAQRAVISRLRSQREAMEAGFFVGRTEPIQKTRLEDITTRLREVRVLIAECAATLPAIERAVSTEEQQLAMHAGATITSPVTGRVWRRYVSAGQYLMPGTTLIDVVESASLRVEAFFHQRNLSRIAVGDSARVSPVGGESSMWGTVEFLGAEPGADMVPRWSSPDDRPMRVVISIDAANRRRVWPGQRVRVSIPRHGLASTWQRLTRTFASARTETVQ